MRLPLYSVSVYSIEVTNDISYAQFVRAISVGLKAIGSLSHLISVHRFRLKAWKCESDF